MKKHLAKIVLCLTIFTGAVLGTKMESFAGNASNSGWVGNYSFSAAVTLSSTYLNASLGSNTADVKIQGTTRAYVGNQLVARDVYARTLDYYVSLQSGLSGSENRFCDVGLQYYVNNTYATRLTTLV